MIQFENDMGTRSEQRLLAVLIRDPACFQYVKDVRPQDFAHGLHGELFRAIAAVIEAGEHASVPHVLAALHLRYRRIPDGWASYLALLSYIDGTPANADVYAGLMRTHQIHQRELA
jgi:replicative DNA helicase